MTRLSVALMAHPSRRAFVEEIVNLVPGIEVVFDRKNDRWDTGSRSLIAYDPTADAHLVIQDDCIPCTNLVAGATAAYAATDGARPVALYTGRVRPHRETVTPTVERALRIGSPWLEMPGPWWGPGLIIPTAHIPELVKWGSQSPQCNDIPNYDRRIGAFYERQGIDCWYTIPSLVDHRQVDENPSLVKGRTGNRQAHAFIGDGDPCAIDWTRRPVRIDDPLTFRNTVTGRVRTVKVGTSQARSMLRHRNWIEEAPDANVPLAA